MYLLLTLWTIISTISRMVSNKASSIVIANF